MATTACADLRSGVSVAGHWRGAACGGGRRRRRAEPPGQISTQGTLGTIHGRIVAIPGRHGAARRVVRARLGCCEPGVSRLPGFGPCLTFCPWKSGRKLGAGRRGEAREGAAWPVASGGSGICHCGISGRRRPGARASIVSICQSPSLAVSRPALARPRRDPPASIAAETGLWPDVQSWNRWARSTPFPPRSAPSAPPFSRQG